MFTFLTSNRAEAVQLMKSQGYIKGNQSVNAFITKANNGEITEEQVIALCAELGYNPDAPVVEEKIAVPAGVTVLTHIAKDGTKVPYAMLPLVRFTSSYAVCQYGNIELYVALGTTAKTWELTNRLEGNPIPAGTLIPAILNSSVNKQGYKTGMQRRSNTDKTMGGAWETSFLTAVHEGCKEIIVKESNAFSRADKIAVLVQSGLTHAQAVTQINLANETSAQEILSQMNGSSPLSAMIMNRK